MLTRSSALPLSPLWKFLPARSTPVLCSCLVWFSINRRIAVSPPSLPPSTVVVNGFKVGLLVLVKCSGALVLYFCFGLVWPWFHQNHRGFTVLCVASSSMWGFPIVLLLLFTVSSRLSVGGSITMMAVRFIRRTSKYEF
ncbi:hypothetical protein A2U01_0014004, partial [Trifolium medium]|nr:hypothetical protein [Trifolium medium]